MPMNHSQAGACVGWVEQSVTHQNPWRNCNWVKYGNNPMMGCALLHPSYRKPYKSIYFIESIYLKHCVIMAPSSSNFLHA